MKVLERQNEVLEEQIKILNTILGFIAPIGSFFSALKVMIKFAAWLTGTMGVGYAFWETFKSYLKNH